MPAGRAIAVSASRRARTLASHRVTGPALSAIAGRGEVVAVARHAQLMTFAPGRHA
jgi:hypothetical protein